MWQFVLVFILGALTVVGVEAAAAVFLIRWLSRRLSREVDKAKVSGELSSPPDLDPSYYNKQGMVWILDLEKIPRAPLDKALGQKKSKKEVLEVSPIQKYAKIKDHSLFLLESDGSNSEIQLRGCTIAAVSATGLSSRKWAKRYPIKVESKSSAIYKGGRTFYIYLETSWDKESWCKALRLASCEDKEKPKWFAKLNIEFHNYLTSLNAVYPSFMKPLSRINNDELIDKSMKFDGSSSRVRLFLKKLAKKTSKTGVENKANWVSNSSQGASTGKPLDSLTEEIVVHSSLSMSARSSGQSHVPVISEADPEDRICNDEGTLCWNLLLSRLFFDAKQNEGIRTSMQARIQRTLSNIRSPSYIGEITCTAVNLGNLPPYIHGMRVLPSDMNEVWLMEIDIEYSGGAILEVETRIEVQDLDLQEGQGTSTETSDVDGVKSDLLEGFEHLEKHLKWSETIDHLNHRDGDFRGDEVKSTGSTTSASPQVSRWKAILHSIAKQVSQVPLSLGIRVASLRGTIRLFIKSPPSDQIWFGFTSMPDLDFQLESSVGEHRITSGHIALFLISRFKTAIRETLVLPNCESVSLGWMLAEKEDWVSSKVAPFIWINNQEVPSTEHEEAKRLDEANRETASSDQEGIQEGSNNTGSPLQQPPNDSLDPPSSSSSSSAPKDQSTMNSTTVKELQAPLLTCEEQRECERSSSEKLECYSPSRPLEEHHIAEPKRMGLTRAKMLGLSKKMGEKLEEKRRHIEEKGRHIVEKMRGQQ